MTETPRAKPPSNERIVRSRQEPITSSHSLDDYCSRLNQIAEISRNARTTWFAFIGVALFSVIAVASVTDKEFFLYGASTKLPVVDVSVPTKSFFYTAPVILLALYTYLHLYLIKLWRALAHLDTKIEALKAYGTELRAFPHPRSPQAIRAIAAACGIKVGLRHAEEFMLIRDIG